MTTSAPEPHHADTYIPSEDELNAQLAVFVRSHPGIRNAVAVSADGITVAYASRTAEPEHFHSDSPNPAELDRTMADQLGAVSSGLSGLVRNGAQIMGLRQVESTMVTTSDGFVVHLPYKNFLASLLVSADEAADPALVVHEMSALMHRIGHVLTPAAQRRMTLGPSAVVRHHP